MYKVVNGDFVKYYRYLGRATKKMFQLGKGSYLYENEELIWSI